MPGTVYCHCMSPHTCDLTVRALVRKPPVRSGGGWQGGVPLCPCVCLCQAIVSATVTWRSAVPLRHSTKKPPIVLCNPGKLLSTWLNGWRFKSCLTSQLPIRPPPVPSPVWPLCARRGSCFDWDLCNLWLLNRVDSRVIHAWSGRLCVDPNTHWVAVLSEADFCTDGQQVRKICRRTN